MNDLKLLSIVSSQFQSTDEQKLIYSGQLLSDSVVLKDVLRQYEGQQAHTVHLVYTPKNTRNYMSSQSMSTCKKPEAKSTTVSSNATATNNASNSSSSNLNGANSTDGLRYLALAFNSKIFQSTYCYFQTRRFRNSAASATNIGAQPLPTQFNAPFIGGLPPTVPHILPGISGFAGISGSPFIPMPIQQTFNGQQLNPQDYAMAQQMAMQNMMQQMYIQYLNHYASIGSS